MNNFEGRYFKPWVGDNYGRNGKSILVLGESIYRCPRTSPDRCIELITNNASGTERHKFYTNIFLAFEGPEKARTPEEKSIFWHSVCYINFVDDLVESSRLSPSRESFDKARDDWQRLLDHFKPDYVVALGKRLWDNLPTGTGQDYISTLDKPNHPVRSYEHSTGTVKITYVYHPSARFSSGVWHQVINELFDNGQQLL